MSRQGIKKKKYVSQVLQKSEACRPKRRIMQARKSLKRKKNLTESKQKTKERSPRKTGVFHFRA